MPLPARHTWAALAVLAAAATSSLTAVTPARAGTATSPAARAVAAARNPTSGFRNPVKENGADPFMVTRQGHYYLTYTRNDRKIFHLNPGDGHGFDGTHFGLIPLTSPRKSPGSSGFTAAKWTCCGNGSAAITPM